MPSTITLACRFPCDVFDPSIEGVDPITQVGTPVPADKEKEIRAAAKANGVSIRKVS